MDSEQPPLSISSKGEVPKSRVPSAKSARSLFEQSRVADLKSAQNRNTVQREIDGHPPFNSEEMRKLGLAEASNLNFGEAQADMDRALAAFEDMLTSQERIAFVKLKSSYSTPSVRSDYENAIAMAYHMANIDWDEWPYQVMMLNWFFNRDGVAIRTFPDARDPRWSAVSLDDFKIPRGTKATEGKVEWAFVRCDKQAWELYDYIKDATQAKSLGWNVVAAKQAIIDTGGGGNDSGLDSQWDWSQFEQLMKNNDYYATTARVSRIKLWGVFVKEFDGSYSYHIFQPDGESEYVYTKNGLFEDALQAFIISTYGIGTNGCYHGVRGLGQRIFPFCQHSNRLRNKVIDGAMMGSSTMFQVEDATQMQKASMAFMGPFGILPQGLKPVEVNMPNPAQGAMPVVADLQATRLSNTGGFMTVGGASGASVERKELDIQNEMANQAVLPASAINRFMLAERRLMKEQLRRLSLTDWAEGEKGYEMAMAFQGYLEEFGVPLEALQHVRSITPARALGAGSPAARQLAFQQMMQLRGQLDEVGGNNLTRDFIGSLVGFDQVDRYAPALANRQRPVIDTKIAELENAALAQGDPIEILDGEDNSIHLKVHVKGLVLESQKLQQGGDPTDLLRYFNVGIPHAEQHMGALAQDDTKMPMISGIKDVLTNLNRMGQQILQALQKQQKAAQASTAGAAPAAGGGMPGPGGSQLSPEAWAKIQQVQTSIQLAQQESQAKMQIKAAEAQQRMQLRDAREAATLQHMQAKQQMAEEIAQ